MQNWQDQGFNPDFSNVIILLSNNLPIATEMDAETRKIQNNRESLRLIAILLLFTMVTVISMMLYLFSEMEGSQRQSLKSQIETALAIDAEHLSDFVNDYAFWDASYQNQITRQNADWIEENTGLYLFKHQAINLTLAVHGDHVPAVVVTDGQNQTVKEHFATIPENIRLLLESRKIKKDFSDISVAESYLDGIYQLSIAFFRNETTEALQDDFAYLVFGRRLNPEYFDYLAQKFRLPGLEIKDLQTPTDACCTIVYRDSSGNPLFQLAWEKLYLTGYFFKVVIYLLIITALIIFLIRMIFASDARQRAAYLGALNERANTDELTGISNRRDFQNRAAHEINRAQRFDESLCLFLLDLDHFKQVNDNYGHQAGDVVLAEIAELIAVNLRDFDLFARYGGEEFVVVLPGTHLSEAYDVAERVRHFIGKEDIPIGAGQRVNCTASIGVAELRTGEDLSTLVGRADKALYAAKRAGRNQSHKAD